MSLDNFFDRVDTLEKRSLVSLPAGFVTTSKMSMVKLPKEYFAAVRKHYPHLTITVVKGSILVTNGR